MCGQFNEQVVSRLNAKAADEGSDRSWPILAVGGRCEDQLLDSDWTVKHTYGLPTSVSDISNLVQELLMDVDRLMTTSEIDRLILFSNRRTSASSFKPRELQLLPLDAASLQRFRREKWTGPSAPMFAGERQRVIKRLVHQYLFVSLFRACAESLASENASRIAAMQAAEKNIEERLDELSRVFNTLRQSSITEELLDVVTGFVALSHQRKKSRQVKT
jgi:F-type H+-transporting ATPase subunit gamma